MRWRLFSFVRRLGNTQGQVMVMVAVSSLALTGFVALATDVGRYMYERQRLQNALDAGALAGAQFLPADGARALSTARSYVRNNDDHHDLDKLSAISVTFGCLVSPDPNNPGLADSSQVAALCPQLKQEPFDCPGNDTCYRQCNFRPNSRDRCNTIQVQAQKIVEFFLASLVGTNSFEADLESHACRGGCGPPPNIDMVLGLDNSPSMFDTGTNPLKFDEAQEGVVSILTGGFLSEEIHRVALATPNEPFIREEFTDQHLAMADRVNALTRQPGTNFAQMLNDAIDLFRRSSSESTNKQIILLTDGRPQDPGDTPCLETEAAAQRAKAEDIRIFLIHYKKPNDDEACNNPGDSGDKAKDFLAKLATKRVTLAEHEDCADENTDLDDYFCEAPGNDLKEIFEIIVTKILNDVGTGSRLVDLSGFN